MSRKGMDTLEVVVEAMLPRLFNTACYLCGDRREAEDAVQETVMGFLESYRKDPSKVRDPMGWCLTVLSRTCRKRHGFRQGVPLPEEEMAQPGPAPEARMMSEERRELVMRAVADLPEAEQEAVSLHVFGGMTIREAAAVLEVPPSTLDKRLQKGLGRLRERLTLLSVAVTVDGLRALPPVSVPSKLAVSLKASAAGVALASTHSVSGGIAMGMFTGKTGLGVGVVALAAMVGMGIEVRGLKQENEALRAGLPKAGKAETGPSAQSQKNEALRAELAALPSPSPQTLPAAHAAPGSAAPVKDLMAKAQAALLIGDIPAFSEAFLALADAGEDASLIPLFLAFFGDKKLTSDPKTRPAVNALWMSLKARTARLGGFMDAILGRDGSPDTATEFALQLMDDDWGAKSRLPREQQAARLMALFSRTQDDNTRGHLAEVLLKKLKATEALPAVEKLFVESKAGNLVEAIGKLEGNEALASLKRLSENSADFQTRNNIWHVLAKMPGKEANDLLWDMLGRARDPDDQSGLLFVLATRPENTERVLAQLRDAQIAPSTSEIVLQALVSIAASKDAGVKDAIWRAYDAEPRLRDEILSKMLPSRDSRAMELLGERLRTGTLPESLVPYLGVLDAKILRENAQALSALAADTGRPLKVRSIAYWVLSRLDARAAVDAFLNGFPQMAERSRVVAVRSLGISKEGREAAQRIAREDPSEKVRAAAQEGSAPTQVYLDDPVDDDPMDPQR